MFKIDDMVYINPTFLSPSASPGSYARLLHQQQAQRITHFTDMQAPERMFSLSESLAKWEASCLVPANIYKPAFHDSTEGRATLRQAMGLDEEYRQALEQIRQATLSINPAWIARTRRWVEEQEAIAWRLEGDDA